MHSYPELKFQNEGHSWYLRVLFANIINHRAEIRCNTSQCWLKYAILDFFSLQYNSKSHL